MDGLRILSGVLAINSDRLDRGTATIHFSPHSVTGDAVGEGLIEISDPFGERFWTKPTRIIYPTHYKSSLVDHDSLWGSQPPTATAPDQPWQFDHGFEITDTFEDTHIEVSWRIYWPWGWPEDRLPSDPDDGEIARIAYLIIGDILQYKLPAGVGVGH